MSNTLQEQLDTLAGFATDDLAIVHPAVISVERRRSPLPRSIAAAAVLVVLLIVGIALLRPGDEVETVGSVRGMGVPGVFLGETVPVADLSGRTQEMWLEHTIAPQLAGEEGVALEFAEVHVTEVGDVAFSAGLDVTGTWVCAISETPGMASGVCNTLSGFAASRNFVNSPGGSNRGLAYVTDDVAAIRIDGDDHRAEGGVVQLDRRIPDLGAELVLIDGTVVPQDLFDGSGSNAVVGLTLNTGSFGSDPMVAGCVSTADGVWVSALVGSDDAGFIPIELMPDGHIYFEGSFSTTGPPHPVRVVVDEVRRTVVSGEVHVSASWDTPESTGSLEVACGDHHIDVTQIRPGGD